MHSNLGIEIRFLMGRYAGSTNGKDTEQVIAPVRLIYALIEVANRPDDHADWRAQSFALIDALSRAPAPAIRWPQGRVVEVPAWRRYSFGRGAGDGSKACLGLAAAEPTCERYFMFDHGADETVSAALYWNWTEIEDESDRLLLQQSAEHLDVLLRRIEVLGRAQSPVSVRLTERLPDGDVYRPQQPLFGSVDSIPLRWAVSERMRERCDAVFNRRAQTHRIYPARAVRYYRSDDMPTSKSLARLNDSRECVRLLLSREMPLAHHERVTDCLHRALCRYSDSPIVTGKVDPHIRLLPVVDGDRMVGIDIAMPNCTSSEEVAKIWDALRCVVSHGLYSKTLRRQRLTLGVAQPATSKVWTTVIPMISERLIRGRDADSRRGWRNMKKSIQQSCRHLGLPDPAEIEVSDTPFSETGIHALGHQRHRRGTRKWVDQGFATVHASLRWTTPVAGPLAIGRGRHFGWGLMAPLLAAGEI